MLQEVVEMATLSPERGESESKFKASSAGLFKRPELTTLVTLPVTAAPTGTTSAPFTVMGVARVASKLDPALAVPVSIGFTNRTLNSVPAGTVTVAGFSCLATAVDCSPFLASRDRAFLPPPFFSGWAVFSAAALSAGGFWFEDWQPIMRTAINPAINAAHFNFAFIGDLLVSPS